MAAQCIQPGDMRLQARKTPRHCRETGLSLNPHLRQRFRAINRLLFLRSETRAACSEATPSPNPS